MTDTTEDTQAPKAGLLQATGDLAKSTARASLAISAFAAHQASGTLSAGTGVHDTASAINSVTTAVEDHLTGPIKTTFAVGHNIQRGLIDAAFGLFGLEQPTGQSVPSGAPRGLAIPMMEGGKRRVAGVNTVSSGAPGRPIPQQELVDTLAQYHADAAASGDLQAIVVGLWKSEGFSTTVGKFMLPENTFGDERIPAGALPIAHVGFGSGTTEKVVFSPEKLNQLFTERVNPHYSDFSYEGIGAILRIYEPGFFKVMSGVLGLIHLDAPDPPDPAGFYAAYLRQFPTHIQRLVAHGYGRIIAFSNMNIYKALEEITTLPSDRIEPAAHGAGFAFAVMNSADLPRLLEESTIPFDPTTRAAFQNGLVYCLTFFEWYVPGLLAAWKPVGPLEAELVEHARAEAALNVARGYPLAFRLENPRIA